MPNNLHRHHWSKAWVRKDFTLSVVIAVFLIFCPVPYDTTIARINVHIHNVCACFYVLYVGLCVYCMYFLDMGLSYRLQLTVISLDQCVDEHYYTE